ncbi:MAG: DUF302 domain-containing protein [Solirubrobacterales bacterium]|nr:DUF302 domain-containing protein [Solirubrobacterales bacterium]
MKVAPSPHSVAATVERLLAALDRRGVPLLARIDHGAGAAAAGLEMGAEQVLLFGDARVGTPLMQADPTIGYELPLRLLIWEDEGQTMIGYRSPAELLSAYAVGAHEETLVRMETLLEVLVVDGTDGA